MKKEHWTWMPHPGHFIDACQCRFHLNTHVGRFVVSTVGEYLPPETTWDIFAKSKGVVLSGIGDARRADYLSRVGYAEVGMNALYETMVFGAIRRTFRCCPYGAAGATKDLARYITPEDAANGHMKLCKKWSRKAEPRS